MKTFSRSFFCFILMCYSLGLRAQTITSFAGNGSSGSSGDGGSALSAGVSWPCIGSFDHLGNYYFGENFGAPRIRMINTAGIIRTIAGNGSNGYSGDGGPATSAQISSPSGENDSVGNFYIADYYNNRIRKVDAATGIITTIAGNGTASSTGDGGSALFATLAPGDLCFDAAGNMYIIDLGYIRKINTTGIISTVGGIGTLGFSGDGGPAIAASITAAYGMCIDATGNLFIACNGGCRIRKINLSTGIITSVAGTGVGLYNGDEIPATSAQFKAYDIACDGNGNLYIADGGNSRVRKVDAAGIIHTIAGTNVVGYSGEGGVATNANMNSPEGLAIDECGNIYVADHFNNRIRRINFSTSTLPVITVSPSPNDTVCAGTAVTYTATIAGVGTPAYQWYVNTTATGTGSSYTYMPANGDVVYCKLTGSALCSGHTVTRISNKVSMVVNPSVTTGITITPSPNDTVCTGAPVTYSAAIAGGGTTPAYQWYKNGAVVSTGTAYSYTPADGDTVRCVLTSNAQCATPAVLSSAMVHMAVLPYGAPAVSISSLPGAEATICSGTTVNFTAAATLPGTAPVYQWKKNGANAGTNAATYSYAPADGDSVRCVLTSNYTCPTGPLSASSGIINMHITPSLNPSITITAISTAPIGYPVTVNALVTGATAYSIKWFRNNVLFSTTTLPTTTYIKAAGGDMISARVIPTATSCYDSATTPQYAVWPLGVDDMQVGGSQVSVYPNPAHGIVSIAGAQQGLISLYNMAGQLLMSKATDALTELDVTGLPEGVYILSIVDEEGSKTVRRILIF